MISNELFLNFSWPVEILLAFAILGSRALIFAGGLSIWIHKSSWARQRWIDKKFNFNSESLKHILTGFSVFFIDSIFAVVMIQTGLWKFRTSQDTSLFILTFLALFVWTEIYFYYSHRLFHHPKLFWIHRYHHQAMALNPWISLSFSFTERIILLLGVAAVPALLSSLIPISQSGYLFYFFTNYVFNVFGHLNVEVLPQRYVQSTFGKIFFTPTYHALHHLRYKGHYGLFTSVLDKIHGSYFHDYPEAHQNNLKPKT